MVAHDERIMRAEVLDDPLALVELDCRPFVIADTATPARVWVCSTQATSGRALWMAPWIT